MRLASIGMVYKPTLFDRLGPDAGNQLRTLGYGILVFGFSIPLFFAANSKRPAPLDGWWAALWVLTCSAAGGAAAALAGHAIATGASESMKRFTMGGSTTPYKEQYSYQQALVMQGRVDDALESFEAVIAENPGEADPRVKAAELYAREKQNFVRAAELFREIQRIEAVSAGQYIYATHRLVDLLSGPLNDPGRAVVELRRLIERYSGSETAERARVALAAIKPRLTPIDSLESDGGTVSRPAD